MGRKSVVIIAVPVLAAAVFTLGWHVVAGRIESRIAELIAPAPDKPWSGRHEGSGVSGFPFSFDVALTDPEFAWQGAAGRLSWKGPHLLVRISPWSPSSYSVALPDTQDMIVDDGLRTTEVALGMRDGRVRVVTASGEVQAVLAEFDGIAATLPPDARALTVDRLVVEGMLAGDEPALDASIVLEGMVLPQPVPAPFDKPMPRTSALLRWSGALPRDGSAAERLDAWREAGGYVEIAELDVTWPPVGIAVNGALALDKALRPTGAFRAELAGYPDLVRTLEAGGILAGAEVLLIGAVLDDMAETQDDGTKRIVTDISIQDGALSIHGVPLLGSIRLMELGPVLPGNSGP